MSYYSKTRIESHFWELQKICLTVNVHLEKKYRLTPKKMIEDSRRAIEVENLKPEEKADMLKDMIKGKGDSNDYLDKKKAEKAIKELRRQGKLL